MDNELHNTSWPPRIPRRIEIDHAFSAMLEELPKKLKGYAAIYIPHLEWQRVDLQLVEDWIAEETKYNLSLAINGGSEHVSFDAQVHPFTTAQIINDLNKPDRFVIGNYVTLQERENLLTYTRAEPGIVTRSSLRSRMQIYTDLQSPYQKYHDALQTAYQQILSGTLPTKNAYTHK
ncbi:MAG: hypothetical protein K9M03_03980 [Kiritimatiellales bacterium]|nr:hypothetical protein [Kiritimatiellales bacterium]